MLGNKRSKVSRHRGSNSHGWGHKKKHRGSGHRGGFGLAGTGARGDSRKTSVLSGAKSLLKQISAQRGVKMSSIEKIGNTYFGKRGFKSINKKDSKVLSIRYIQDNFDKMVENGMIVKEKEGYVFDSTLYGYDKILGKCNFTHKLIVICDDISESARSRIEGVGGKVEVKGFEEDSFDEE